MGSHFWKSSVHIERFEEKGNVLFSAGCINGPMSMQWLLRTFLMGSYISCIKRFVTKVWLRYKIRLPHTILCWRGKVCYLVFVVPCEGSEAEALKYMRGVNLAWVARASLSEENQFGPAAASLALPAQPSRPECGVGSAWERAECQVWTGVTQLSAV